MKTTPSTTSVEEVLDILRTLDKKRIPELFKGQALMHIHEVLVEALSTIPWNLSRAYRDRAEFLQAMRPFTKDADNYRRLFLAMCEAGSTQGTLGMLHAAGRKDRVLLGNQALLTMGTLIGMVKHNREGVAPVVHFMTRAAVSQLPEEPPALYKALVKGYDPNMANSGRWLEAIQSMARARSLAALCLPEKQSTPGYWVNQMIYSESRKDTDIASAMVAGLIAKGSVSIQSLRKMDLDLSQKVRVIKGLGLKPEEFGMNRIISPKSSYEKPSYRIDQLSI